MQSSVIQNMEVHICIEKYCISKRIDTLLLLKKKWINFRDYILSLPNTHDTPLWLTYVYEY